VLSVLLAGGPERGVTWQSGPDVICLQEVQADHYESWWRPQLARHGYSGTYSAKTKEAMGEHAYQP